MQRYKCVECDKTLRNYKLGDKRVHRSCWLKLRSKDERHFDFLFCKDKNKRDMKKMKIIHPDDLQPSLLKTNQLPPINEEEIQILDTKGNLISIPKSFVIEKTVLGVSDVTEDEDQIMNQIMDIAGNIYTLDENLISFPSSPPAPPPSPQSDSLI
jgi:hypothetical protein